MEQIFNERGKLPACRLSEALLDEIWRVVGQDGDFIWQSVVGMGGDILGRIEERPKEIVTNRERLIELLSTLPRIDSFQLTMEVEGKGAISLSFLNYAPIGGAIVISSHNEKWAQDRYDQIYDVLESAKDEKATKLSNRWIFGTIQTAIPMSIAFVVVVLVAGLLIPTSIRHSEFLWWITAGTIVATLKLAYEISNRLIVHFITKHPYIRWGS